MIRPSLLIVTTALLLVSTASVAHAQGGNSAQAEQLFREGKRLMGEGKIAEACKAFEGSYRKDAVVTTLLNLADCREKNGQFATAWGNFLDAERMSRGHATQANFNSTARKRATGLEAKLSYLIINVPAGAAVDGLVITRNGNVVDEAEWNTDIPVDGGDYVIEGKAPGYEAWSTRVTVGNERDKQSVNVPKFRERPGTPGTGDGSEVTPPDPGDKGVPVPADRAAGSGRKKLGVVAVAGGGALVLGGLAVGYLAQQKWSEAKELCGDDLVCDTAADRMAGDALVDAARFRGNVSTIVTGVGIAAVGVGVVLWVTAPKAETRRGAVSLTPVVSRDSVGLVLGGAL
jgi:hypothetical protein